MELFDPTLWHRQGFAATVLKAAVSQGRLGHAYLLSGRCLNDKWQMARQLACYLNCLSEDKEKRGSCALHLGVAHDPEAACQSNKLCQNCAWIMSSKHPKAFVELAANKESKSGKIPVEKARELAHDLGKTSDYFRVVVIADAREEILHRPAANALLKTIEEPPENTLFLLFANHWQEVLPTIVSRCQVLTMVNEAAAPAFADSEQLSQLKELIGVSTNQRNAFMEHSDHEARRVLSSLTWSKSAYAFSDDNEVELGDLIDQLVLSEVSELKERALVSKSVFAYIQELIRLADKTKQQLDHYVSGKSAAEYFALCLRKLRQDYLGSGLIGKG